MGGLASPPPVAPAQAGAQYAAACRDGRYRGKPLDLASDQRTAWAQQPGLAARVAMDDTAYWAPAFAGATTENGLLTTKRMTGHRASPVDDNSLPPT